MNILGVLINNTKNEKNCPFFKLNIFFRLINSQIPQKKVHVVNKKDSVKLNPKMK